MCRVESTQGSPGGSGVGALLAGGRKDEMGKKAAGFDGFAKHFTTRSFSIYTNRHIATFLFSAMNGTAQCFAKWAMAGDGARPALARHADGKMKLPREEPKEEVGGVNASVFPFPKCCCGSGQHARLRPRSGEG